MSRRFAFLVLVLAATLVLRPVGVAAAGAVEARVAPQTAAVWAGAIDGFFRAKSPDLSSLKPVLASLSRLDLKDPAVLVQLEPVLAQARASASEFLDENFFPEGAPREENIRKLALLEGAFGDLLTPSQLAQALRLSNIYRARGGAEKQRKIAEMVLEAAQSWRVGEEHAGTWYLPATALLRLPPPEGEPAAKAPPPAPRYAVYLAPELKPTRFALVKHALYDKVKRQYAKAWRPAVLAGIVGALTVIPVSLHAAGVNPLPDPLGNPFVTLGLAAAMTALIDLPLDYAAYRLNSREMHEEQPPEPSESLAAQAAWMAAVAVLEEALFRGLLFGGGYLGLTLIGVPTLVAFAVPALVSSYVFALAHGYGPVWTRAVGGLLYAGLFFVTGNLLWPILLHFLFNMTWDVMSRIDEYKERRHYEEVSRAK